MDLLRLEQNPMGKRCVRCGQWKSLSDFNYNHVNGTHGRQSYCRRCQHEYAAQNYLAKAGQHDASETHNEDKALQYGELYASYKRYRLLLESFTSMSNEDIEERLSFEYDLGL